MLINKETTQIGRIQKKIKLVELNNQQDTNEKSGHAWTQSWHQIKRRNLLRTPPAPVYSIWEIYSASLPEGSFVAWIFRKVAGGELAWRLIKLGEGLARQRGTLASSLAGTKPEATVSTHPKGQPNWIPASGVRMRRWGPGLNTFKESYIRQKRYLSRMKGSQAGMGLANNLLTFYKLLLICATCSLCARCWGKHKTSKTWFPRCLISS